MISQRCSEADPISALHAKQENEKTAQKAEGMRKRIPSAAFTGHSPFTAFSQTGLIVDWHRIMRAVRVLAERKETCVWFSACRRRSKLIEVRNLTKRYGDHLAVDDLSFRVEDGKIYGFLGPNGAGKSTTMNIMTGYIGPTAGEVFVNGYNILEEPEAAKKTIGYLPEIPPVYPEMTVREYLDFAAELKKVPKKERKARAQQVMEELSLTEVQDRLIRNLSKGYKQRVGFAQALIGNPQTLILDEPTVGLDPKQIIEIRALIRKLGERHTVILSSHILSEVSEVCDKVIVISKGKLAALDTPENLRDGRKEKAILHISCEGSADRAYEAVSGVVKISREAVTEEADGMIRITIETENGDEVRRMVSRALFDADCVISEMHLEEATLENIFLELTDAEAAKDAKQDAGKAPEKERPETGKRKRRTVKEAITDFFFEPAEPEVDTDEEKASEAVKHADAVPDADDKTDDHAGKEAED